MTILLGFWEFLDKHSEGLAFLTIILAVIIGATVASMFGGGER